MEALIIIILVIGMCFSIFNYWFQKEKYRRMSKDEIKKQNFFNAPWIWLFASIIMFLCMAGYICYFVYKMYDSIFKLS